MIGGTGHCIFTVIPAPLPSFPRKRESRGCLTRMWHNKAAPFGIPAYAGRTVEWAVGRTVRKARE